MRNKICAVLNHPQAQAARMVYDLLGGEKENEEDTEMEVGIVSYDRSSGVFGRCSTPEVFTRTRLDLYLYGLDAIGCSCCGPQTLTAIQPTFGFLSYGRFAVCMSGEISNRSELLAELNPPLRHTDCDAELFLHLVVSLHRPNLWSALNTAISRIQGAYTFLAMGGGVMYVSRQQQDPFWTGRMREAIVIASDRDILRGATEVRPVEKGMALISQQPSLF